MCQYKIFFLTQEFSGKPVVFIAQRRILPKLTATRKANELKQKRPIKRTLNAVQSQSAMEGFGSWKDGSKSGGGKRKEDEGSKPEVSLVSAAGL